MNRPIRLLLADDHSIVLMGLAALLKFEPGLEVVATAENGARAIDLYREHQPDVVLMDLRMPGVDGIEATREIRREFPEARVLMLTSFDREEDIHFALKAGIRGYILKESKLPELAQAIRDVHAGKTYLPRQVTLIARERANQPDLSRREIEVLDLVAKGLTNKEIASVLGFSEDGAKHHLRNIFAKLGVTGRTEAITEAMRRGILRSAE